MTPIIISGKIGSGKSTVCKLFEDHGYMSISSDVMAKDLIRTNEVIKKSLIDTIYHEHINYFTKKSLNILFQKNGLEIFKFNVFGNKGGSLRIFFRLMKNKTITKQNVQRELDAESKKINLKEIRNFKKKINENKRSLKSFLLSQKFHKISGFGASVGTSTLIRFFELENFIVSYWRFSIRNSFKA